MKGEKTIDNMFMLWGLVGPLMIVLSLSFVIAKSEWHTLYFPLVALLGIPLCWRWRLRGLVPAFALLGVFCVITLRQVSIHEQYWFFGMTLSFALGLFITALSVEELSDLLASIQSESDSRLEYIRKLTHQQQQFEEKYNRLAEESQRLRTELQRHQDLLFDHEHAQTGQKVQ